MLAMRWRTSRGMSTYVEVVISPATTTRPVVISVSQATRPVGSSVRTASRTESETWSATLSGWPSVTDSELKRKLLAAMRGTLAPAAAPARRLLVGRPATHQAARELEQRPALEHRADALGDRQLDAEAPREVAEHRRRRQPLDDLRDLRPRLFGRRAAGH